MARNRKRRSAARTRRPGNAPAVQPGVATASGDRPDETPDAIEHATPDVELAEAQLALGRPEYTDADLAAEQPDDDDSLDAEPGDEEPADDAGGGGYDERGDDFGSDDGRSGGDRHGASRGCRRVESGPAAALSTSFREAGASSSEYSGPTVGR